MDLLDGYAWQEMLELYVPYLSKFEFHMSIWKYCPRTDLNIVVNSFKYFVTKYFNWHMIIDQWSLLHSIPVDIISSVNFHETSDDDAEEIVNYLSNWLYLAKECLNLTSLTILTELLIYSKFIDNSFLIPVFKRIELIETTFEDVYFPPSFSMKFVNRFLSLEHIELQVISFNDCVFIIDTFLSHLKNLSYLKIDYFEDSLLDDPFSLENIIEKRRQAFPMDIIHEQLINVKNGREVIEIWLK
ncbi:unnamed protein product [Adineta steineri]|nr:unnamed protein product [Adineta steineri]